MILTKKELEQKGTRIKSSWPYDFYDFEGSVYCINVTTYGQRNKLYLADNFTLIEEGLFDYCSVDRLSLLTAMYEILQKINEINEKFE